MKIDLLGKYVMYATKITTPALTNSTCPPQC